MDRNILRLPFYIMLHPSDGFGTMKWEKKGSFFVSFIILGLLFFANVLSIEVTGFMFNNSRPDKINILKELAMTLVPFLLWVAANWSLCSLMESEGTLSEIWISSAYALLPLVTLSIFCTVISNLMALREGTFLNMLQIVSKGWTVLLFITAMKEIHQYTVKKTLLSITLTLVGAAFILFLLVLAFTMFQQLYLFLHAIYNELMFRL